MRSEDGDDSFIEDPLVFLAQPDSIMITREFAAERVEGQRCVDAAVDGRAEAVCGAGDYEVERVDVGLWRQSGDYGRLRGAEGVWPGAAV
jgi:hypothetical protein